MNLSHFTQLVISAECQNDPDVVGHPHAPPEGKKSGNPLYDQGLLSAPFVDVSSGNFFLVADNLKIHPPYQLNVRIFDPMFRREAHHQEKKQKLRSSKKW